MKKEWIWMINSCKLKPKGRKVVEGEEE